MQFRKYFLVYTLLPLIVLLISASFYRFIILRDYIVVFEGDCNPESSNCFIGCNDEECTDIYHFVKVRTHASEIYAKCGNNIKDCEAANSCDIKSETRCSVSQCDPVTDGDSCEVIEQTNFNEAQQI